MPEGGAKGQVGMDLGQGTDGLTFEKTFKLQGKSFFLKKISLPVHAEPPRLLVLADRPAHVVVGQVGNVVAGLVD